MRTIREIISKEKAVYIFLKDRAVAYRFLSDAEREGLTIGNDVKPTKAHISDIMRLHKNGNLSYVGIIGRICFQSNADSAIRVDYEKYICGEADYIITRSVNKH